MRASPFYPATLLQGSHVRGKLLAIYSVCTRSLLGSSCRVVVLLHLVVHFLVLHRLRSRCRISSWSRSLGEGSGSEQASDQSSDQFLHDILNYANLGGTGRLSRPVTAINEPRGISVDMKLHEI